MDVHGVELPTVLLTDKDLACLDALSRAFPTVLSMICRWHMNRNVLSRTREELGQVRVINPAPGQDKHENSPATDIFMAAYYATLDSATKSEFERNRSILKAINSVLAKYLDNHW